MGQSVGTRRSTVHRRIVRPADSRLNETPGASYRDRMCLRLACAALLLTVPVLSTAQPRSMSQDPALNNLVHDPGTATAAPGSLGHVTKVGTGPRKMLLLAGLGFSDGVWAEFMERHRADATLIAVTLPGFGGTAPLPMPGAGTPYAALTWTRANLKALESLLAAENFVDVTVVAHWALASQMALQLALDHPERIASVVLIGGPLKVYYESGKGMLDWSTERRAQFVEGMGSRWFKSVTRRTWDDNNFMPYDYAVNPRRGLFLWREAQAPPLPVWIRYLLEFYSIDMTPRLSEIVQPVLVIQPGFDDPDFYVETDRNYMRNLCIDSWKGAGALNGKIDIVTVPKSRLFVMFDQPVVLDELIARFLASHAPAGGVQAARRR